MLKATHFLNILENIRKDIELDIKNYKVMKKVSAVMIDLVDHLKLKYMSKLIIEVMRISKLP